MSKMILPSAFGQNAIGVQNVRIGWDGTRNPLSASLKLSLGFLPANAVVKAIRGTLMVAEGGAGNLLVATSTDGGTTCTTRLTIDANAAVGTRTAVPANIDDVTNATSATGGVVALDTATATNVEMFLLGSTGLDAAKAVIDLEVYFGPTAGENGTGVLSL